MPQIWKLLVAMFIPSHLFLHRYPINCATSLRVLTTPVLHKLAVALSAQERCKRPNNSSEKHWLKVSDQLIGPSWSQKQPSYV